MTLIKALFSFLFAMGVLTILLYLKQKLNLWLMKKIHFRPFVKNRFRQREIFVRPAWMIKLDRVISVGGHTFASDVLLLVCTVFVFPGFLWGVGSFQHVALGLIFGIITGSIPIVYIHFRFYLRQREMASLMMPTFQIFLGVYSSNPNIRRCLQQCTPLLPSYMRYEFQILTNSINTGIGLEKALVELGERAGNPFAEDFADLLVTSDETGEDIQHSLMNLINRTQNYKFNSEMERTELIDIRYGTMIIIGLTLFLIFYNIHLGKSPFDPTNPIHAYYTQTNSGQLIIGAVAVVQFVGLLGSLWIGRKKI
jgi:Flp pilus assembly protein TadB